MVAATAVGALGLWWLAEAALAVARAVGAASPAAPDEVLTLMAALAALAVGGWLLVGFTLSVLAHLPGSAGNLARRWAEQISPAVVRRVAAVVVGASLSGALAPGTATADGPAAGAAGGPAGGAAGVAAYGPAGGHAASGAPVAGAPSPALAPSSGSATGTPAGTPSPGLAPSTRATPAPAPGWTPDRPVVRRQASTRLVATDPPADERPGVVVRRGDTLWDLVQRHLGPDASDAEVAAEWPRWHEANRDVIGHDPDLLLPGQVLQAPATEAVRR